MLTHQASPTHFGRLWQKGLITLMVLLFAGLIGCAHEDAPPEQLVDRATKLTESIINDVVEERKLVKGPVELVREYY